MRESIRRRLDPDARYGLRVTLFGLAFLLVAIPFGLLIEQIKNNRSLVRLDTSAANHLHGWVRGSPTLVTDLKILTFFGTPVWFYVIVIPTVIWLWRAGYPRLAIFLVVTTLAGGVLDTIVKEVVNRARPSLVDPVATAHGKSFPSGHAMSSTFTYGALILVFLPMIAKRYRPLVIGGAVLLVVAICFSRLALGVHFITDVVGGVVLGLAWLAASTAAFSIWRVDRGRPPVEVSEGVEPEVADAV